MLGYASPILPHWALNPLKVAEQVAGAAFSPKTGVLDHYQAPHFITPQCVSFSRAKIPLLVAD
jgi:hypothetical protein